MVIGKHSDNFSFGCGKCNRRMSLKNGTFTSGSHIPSRTFLWLFAHMCNWRSYTQVSIARFTGLSEHTVSDWCSLIRETLSVYVRHHPVILGGHGDVGYADGTYIGTTAKYGRGNKLRGLHNRKGKRILLLIMSEQSSKRVQVRVIKSENVSTI